MRGYCGKRGLSIGFGFNEMYEQVSNQKYILFPCIYEKEKQVAMANYLIEKMHDEYRENEYSFGEDTGAGLFQLYNMIMDNLIIMAKRTTKVKILYLSRKQKNTAIRRLQCPNFDWCDPAGI